MSQAAALSRSEQWKKKNTVQWKTTLAQIAEYPTTRTVYVVG